MSLTVGRAPFGEEPAGTFNFRPPEHVVYVEHLPRRVRAQRQGEFVIDSDAVLLVHESGKLPHYAFPRADVRLDAAPEPHVDGHVTVPWDAVDAWFEEDERVEVHPRDPYHRIDTFSTRRRVVVSLNGVQLADSTKSMALYETSLPVRYYLPRDDVAMDLLEPSATVTQCAYKGTAGHWSARVGGELIPDVAWWYEEPRREAERVKGFIAFYNERVDLDVDGAREQRPRTAWSQ